jgi:hypothetical protein
MSGLQLFITGLVLLVFAVAAYLRSNRVSGFVASVFLFALSLLLGVFGTMITVVVFVAWASLKLIGLNFI